MKIAYGSDFHFEFYKDGGRKIIEQWDIAPFTEQLIIAGDLNVGAKAVINTLEFIHEVHKIPIIYVPGNHEYYHGTFKEVNDGFMTEGTKAWDKYKILLKHAVLDDTVMFFGCMGNLDGTYQPINRGIHGALADFDYIGDFRDRVKLGTIERITMIECLEKARQKEWDYNTVIITHTMPTPMCITERYRGSYLNGCFTNDWEDIIVEYKPKYWICGHTHDRNEVLCDDTYILINPYGYPRETKQWEWRYFDV